MNNFRYDNPHLFEAFIKSSQYLASLKTQQDIWDHLGKFIRTYFPAGWTAFAERDSDNTITIHHSSLSEAQTNQYLLTGEVRRIITDVLDSGFLASLIIPVPSPSITAFLPIMEEHKTENVMLIGHQTTEAISKDLLNIYLAIASLAGTTSERLRNEQELNRHRTGLEELVKERTTELARAKRQNELILQSVGEGICGLDLKGRIIFVNLSVAKMLEWNPEELIGRDAHSTFHHTRLDGCSYPIDECPVLVALKSGNTNHIVDECFFRKDGTRFPVEFIITPIKEGSNILGAVMVFQDITARKQTEEALRIKNERLAILSEASSLLLSSNTPETMVQTIASKVMAHLGCDCFFNFIADEEAGKLRLNAYAGISEEVAKGIAWLNYGEAICGSAARDGCRIISENVKENGDMRAALVRSFGVQAYAAHPLKAGIKTIGTLSFGTRSRNSFTEDELDLMQTVAGQVSVAMERKLAEEALKRYASELEIANKELEAFSYSVSHDLRAPLRGIDGFSLAVLEDYGDKLDKQGKDYLNRVRGASQLMGQLIDDMLKLSRITRSEIHLEEVNLTEIARSIAEELKKSQPERAIGFIISPDMVAKGDKILLSALLRNLLENSWKFTSKTPQASIEFGLIKEADDTVYFVKDNGTGFDMQYANKLFKPFQRLHSQTEYPGTGIGLANVSRIVRRHGGKVWAEGEQGKGATFFFTLGEKF